MEADRMAEERRRARKRRKGGAGLQQPPPTPFRVAERKYKLYRDPKLLQRQNFEDVMDFGCLDCNTAEARAKIISLGEVVVQSESEGERSLKIFGHKDRSGFFYVPCALSQREQLQWARTCLADYPKAPHHTNLGILPFSLWENHMAMHGSGLGGTSAPSVTGKRRRSREHSKSAVAQTHAGATKEDNNSSAYRSLGQLQQATIVKEDAEVPALAKLRWATLGYHYDWTNNVYRQGSLWHSPFPSELARMAESLAEKITGKPFVAEAAIVNYYQGETMLKAHQDESEFTFDAPIVSLSIGNDCIFLLGGATTDDPPTAVRFRSGDLMLMGGHSRVAFHGVPRVFSGSFDCNSFVEKDMDDQTRRVVEYLSSARININVRQVFPPNSVGTFLTDRERLDKLRRHCEAAIEHRSKATVEAGEQPERSNKRETQAVATEQCIE